MKGLQTVVRTVCVILGLLFSVRCDLVMVATQPLIDNAAANEQIREIKTWFPTSEAAGLYELPSDETLKKTLQFAEDPTGHYDQIKVLDVTQFWNGIRISDAFMYEKKRAKSRFYFHERLSDFCGIGRWHGVNAHMDISIITFLLLNGPSGEYGGLIRDLYLDTFDSYWHSFIPQLKKRADWKLIVDEFGAERTERIKKVMKHLRKSKFEKELRDYLLTRYPALGDSS